MKNTTEPTRDQQIKAAGMVQAVVSSGCPVEEWESLTRFGLKLSIYFARVLAGQKPKKPVYASNDQSRKATKS